jgi:hypothetical protein
MARYLLCAAVALLAGLPLRAGELDREFKSKAPKVSQVSAMSGDASAALPMLVYRNKNEAPKASELDQESPAQSWRRCGWGGGWGGYRGCGWGGWGGYRSCGWGGWGGWGGYRGWGCGWGGYAYRSCYSYYPSYVSVGWNYPAYNYYW